METKNKLVSVVITAYNVGPWIEQSVNSALQDGVDEVIVVVDKPTDDTLEKVVKINDKRLLVLDNQENVGAGLSRRIGIAYANSEYVLLLDGDDYLEDGFVRALLDRAIETDADVVSGGIKISNEDGSWRAESYGNNVCRGNDKIARFWGERIVFMNNKLIRRSLYEKVPYNHRRYIEDTPTIIPILWYANECQYVDNVGYVYRMREGSLTHTTNKLKDVIYKGLCWLDLMDFFTKNDESVFSAIDIKGYVKNILAVLNQFQSVTDKEIEPYKEEWIEFTTRLFNMIVINNIDFKSHA